MASILPGYEYDIFISYRQKDNKGDKWVSEFVEALKLELDATFKEDISIYYDENPHDGLLETHDVDASLREKLRCLVFIPVVSRTYCDPNSFAWEHEFRSFVDLASNDSVGLKVKLPNGNVAGRVLPVRIHELEPEDHKLCESVLGGALRGVDFIYKSVGVNRPLRSNEDYPQNNLNKTYYRDQINKVANAIDEIFYALKHPDIAGGSESARSGKVKRADDQVSRLAGRFEPFKRKPVRRTLLFLSFVLCAACAIIFYNIIDRREIRKSVAILPFTSLQDDPGNVSSGNIFAMTIQDNLGIVRSLTVRSTISTFLYRDTKKSLRKIRKELDVTYLVNGSVRRDSNRTMIMVMLTDARHDKQLWSEEYLWDNDRLTSTVSDIVKKIASRCNVPISLEEMMQIDSAPTKNNEAYLNFLSANVTYNEAWNLFNTGSTMLKSENIRSAISDYDRAIMYDSLFAEAYARRSIAISWGCYTGDLDSSEYRGKCRDDIIKSLVLDPDLIEAQIAWGFYYYFIDRNYERALVYFNRAAVRDPGNYQPFFYMALVYRRMGDWGRSQSHIFRVIQQNPQVPLFLTNIGLSYNYLHKFDSAIIYHQKTIDIAPDWTAGYVNMIESLLLRDGKTREARRVLEEAERNTGREFTGTRIRLDLYDGKYKDALIRTEKASPVVLSSDYERFITLGRILSLLKDKQRSAKYYDSALAVLPLDNRDYLMHSNAALAYAGKGNRGKALAEARLAIELSELNRMDQSDMKVVQAKVFTMVGEYDDAVMSIEYLLENPSSFSKNMLLLEPEWEGLLENPGIKALMKKYER